MCLECGDGIDAGYCLSCAAKEGFREVIARALVQEAYDATTVLIAALSFTHCTEDLVKPELNDAIKRVIVARNGLRRSRLVEHREAALVSQYEPPK